VAGQDDDDHNNNTDDEDDHDNDPAYLQARDDVLHSVLRRLPVSSPSLAAQYRIVCNIEARPDFGGRVKLDKFGREKPPEKNAYRVWVAVHLQALESAGDARDALCTLVHSGHRGEIINECTTVPNPNALECATLMEHLDPFHNPSMQQLLRHLKGAESLSAELCRHIFGFLEIPGAECVSVNGVSERCMVHTWAEIIRKWSYYMNAGQGYMLHPMWRWYDDMEWGCCREQSCGFDGDHWGMHQLSNRACK